MEINFVLMMISFRVLKKNSIVFRISFVFGLMMINFDGLGISLVILRVVLKIKIGINFVMVMIDFGDWVRSFFLVKFFLLFFC